MALLQDEDVGGANEYKLSSEDVKKKPGVSPLGNAPKIST